MNFFLFFFTKLRGRIILMNLAATPKFPTSMLDLMAIRTHIKRCFGCNGSSARTLVHNAMVCTLDSLALLVNNLSANL